MDGKKRQYDADIKKEIVQVYLDGRRTASSLASELGVRVNTIKWSVQYRADPENTFHGIGHMYPDKEELA